MKKTLAALFTALTLSIAACGGGAASAAGVYEIDKAALKAAITASMPAEAKDKMPAEMLDGMVNGMNISIELKADGTATMSSKMDVMGQKKEDVATGTWKLDGNKLTMTTEDKDGKKETKTVDYQAGSFSVEADEGPMKMKMTFKKK